MVARVEPRLAGEHRVALAQACRARILDLLLPLDPAVAGHEHVIVLGDDEVLGGELGLVSDLLDASCRRLSFLA